MVQNIFDYNINGLHFRCVRKNFRLRSHVVFQIKQSNDFITMRGGYRFQKVECIYSSPYLSWMNQLHCGGWTLPQDYLYNAVQNGKKLYAGLSFYIGHSDNYSGLSEHDSEAIDTIKASLPADCILGEEDVQNPVFLPFYICRHGTIADYINLSAVYEDYKALEIQIDQSEQRRIEELCSLPIQTFSKSDIMDYANPVTLPEIITTGLLLGYPLEATTSYILN